MQVESYWGNVEHDLAPRLLRRRASAALSFASRLPIGKYGSMLSASRAHFQYLWPGQGRWPSGLNFVLGAERDILIYGDGSVYALT